MKNLIVALSVATGTVLLASGCGNGGKYGAEVPQEGAVIPLSDILAKPSAFDRKMVILEGTVSAVCPSFCDFTYAEGTTSSMVYPREFMLKGLKKGKKVRVYAEIFAGKERPVISAHGVAVR